MQGFAQYPSLAYPRAILKKASPLQKTTTLPTSSRAAATAEMIVRKKLPFDILAIAHRRHASNPQQRRMGSCRGR